ncbi:MAG: hypothetical protein V4708_10710 [Bacteroidota bacterium]
MPKYNLPLTNTLYLKNLKSYLKLADENIKNFEKQKAEFTQRVINDQVDDNWLDEGSHVNNIEWLFLNSLYVTMYAAFEHFLLKVASTLECQPGIVIKLSNISGKGILDQYTTYLRLVGGIACASRDLAYWSRMSHYQSVRNLLAHNGGIMRESDDKPLEKHKNFKFLENEDVIMAGSLGLIRIRNKKILESFALDSTRITNDVIREFNLKYA